LWRRQNREKIIKDRMVERVLKERESLTEEG
jgi:hypothetical protein